MSLSAPLLSTLPTKQTNIEYVSSPADLVRFCLADTAAGLTPKSSSTRSKVSHFASILSLKAGACFTRTIAVVFCCFSSLWFGGKW